MNTILVEFEGVDSWNRPVFKDEFSNRYGCLDKLFDFDSDKIHILNMVYDTDLVYFGRKFNCRPNGDRVRGTIKIVRNY